jgi:Kef-type K+ transport system membrane component KefB
VALEIPEVLFTIGGMVVAAAVFAMIARKLHQPLIFGYIFAGIIIGPAVTGIVSDPGPLIWLSEMALIFLLFVIGLQLDLSKIKEVGCILVCGGCTLFGVFFSHWFVRCRHSSFEHEA